MSTKHTPGPWEIMERKRSGHADIILYKGRKFAQVGAHVADDKVQTANARLIAAAPDLLEACKAALATLDTWEESDSWDESDSEAYGLIASAIAKATGEPLSLDTEE